MRRLTLQDKHGVHKEVLARLLQPWLTDPMSMSSTHSSLSGALAETGLRRAEKMNLNQELESGEGRIEQLFASRARLMRPSAVRESLKFASQPDIISFAGGLPAPELFAMARVKAA